MSLHEAYISSVCVPVIMDFLRPTCWSTWLSLLCRHEDNIKAKQRAWQLQFYCRVWRNQSFVRELCRIVTSFSHVENRLAVTQRDLCQEHWCPPAETSSFVLQALPKATAYKGMTGTRRSHAARCTLSELGSKRQVIHVGFEAVHVETNEISSDRVTNSSVKITLNANNKMQLTIYSSMVG